MSNFLENERRLAAAFLLCNIVEVSVNFDGSGDSGQIDNIDILCGDGTQVTTGLPIMMKVLGPRQFNSASQEWETPKVIEQEMSLCDAIEHHVYEALDHTQVDWYNNDGGFGYWRWTPNNGLEFSIDQRTTHSETVYFDDRRLGEEEDV